MTIIHSLSWESAFSSFLWIPIWTLLHFRKFWRSKFNQTKKFSTKDGFCKYDIDNTICLSNKLSVFEMSRTYGIQCIFPLGCHKTSKSVTTKNSIFQWWYFSCKSRNVLYIYRINIPYTRFLFFICNNFVITVLRVLLLYPEEMFFQPYAYSLIFHISLLHASLTRNIHYMQINIPSFLSTIIEFWSF